MNTEVNDKVIKELKRMGFSDKHIGTTYIKEAIEIIYKSKNPKLIKSVEKTVYKQIADKYSKKLSTIKSNIVKATNYVYEQKLLKNQKKPNSIYFFNIYEKSTPKMVINTVLEKIRA